MDNEEKCENCIYARFSENLGRGNSKKHLFIFCDCPQTVWHEASEDVNLIDDSAIIALNCPYYISRKYLYQPESVTKHWKINECCDTCTHKDRDCEQSGDAFYGKKLYEHKSFKSPCPKYNSNQYHTDEKGNCIISLETFREFLKDYERLRVTHGYEKDCRIKAERKMERTFAKLNGFDPENMLSGRELAEGKTLREAIAKVYLEEEEKRLDCIDELNATKKAIEKELRELNRQHSLKAHDLSMTEAEIKMQKNKLKDYENDLRAREDKINAKKLDLSAQEQRQDREATKRKAKLDKQETSLKMREIGLRKREAELQKREAEAGELSKVNKDNELLLFFKSELPDVYKSLNKELKRRMNND